MSMTSPSTSAFSSPLRGQPGVRQLTRDDSIDGHLSPKVGGPASASTSSGHGLDASEAATITASAKKKRYPTERPYFIAKEILMTERTYKKDLEVINLWFRDEVAKEQDAENEAASLPEEALALLFMHLDPIYEKHCALLKDIENRMAVW